MVAIIMPHNPFCLIGRQAELVPASGGFAEIFDDLPRLILFTARHRHTPFFINLRPMPPRRAAPALELYVAEYAGRQANSGVS